MDIKMPLKFHGTYHITVREGDSEKRETCQKLVMSKLSQDPASSADPSGEKTPTHLIVYYSFGCKRMIEGRLKENLDNKAVFQVLNKEYEFSTR